MTVTTAPDLEAIKAKQQQTWASGDYHAIAATIPLISERLVDNADLRAGSRVLDVAGGSGNTALAAARIGADVVTLDYVPSLLERSRDRARAEGLSYTTVVGDAEAMVFDDGAFDAVISAVGVMFAPDHERAAAELLRVCRPGGTIALANWAPDSFIGDLFRTTAKHVPQPAGLQPPGLWGTEDHVRELFGDGVTGLRAIRRTYTFRYRSAGHFVDYFRAFYGPTHKAFAALDRDGQKVLAADLADLVARSNRLVAEDAVAVPADYLEIIATRAG
jgi:SAM-dependent methyltransferase